MKLEQLAAVVGGVVEGDGGVEVAGVAVDSRHVQRGDLFAAVPGSRVDGARFVEDAQQRGAAAVLAQGRVAASVPVLRVDAVRPVLGTVCDRVYGTSAAGMHLVGVTGTNGKTTVTHLVAHVLCGAGVPCGVMGTIAHHFGSWRVTASHTTPDTATVHRTLAHMRRRGARACAMEVSSHALDQGRVDGCRFAVRVFTNLTQDHLDYHETMEAYGAAKLRLFAAQYAADGARAVVNADDPFGAAVAQAAHGPVWTVSLDPLSDADFRPRVAPQMSLRGTRIDARTPEGDVRFDLPIPGAFNAHNALTALAAACALDVPATRAAQLLSSAPPVPGRLEAVPNHSDVAVLVDYAHTPDALDKVLAALRPLCTGRLWCVFGCGGDRDKQKRPLMARAVAAHADVAVVTSDNPRTEDPMAIISMVVEGLRDTPLQRRSVESLAAGASGWTTEPDRAAAIALAVAHARPGDAVLIAGKGHEDYIIEGTTKRHFDDRECAAACLARREEGAC